MRLFGILIALALLAFLAFEIYLLILVGAWLNHTFEAQIGGSGGILVVAWVILSGFIGFKVVKKHVALIVPGFLTGNAGPHLIAAIGGVLLVLPGLITDAIGLILLLPPVQKILGRFGQVLIAVMVKKYLARMMAGGGAPGGNPFAAFGGGGAFPGMKPLTPDDKVGMFGKGAGKKPKTYDAKPEK